MVLSVSLLLTDSSGHIHLQIYHRIYHQAYFFKQKSVVPANKEGFKKVFLGQHCWYAIRIAGGRLDQIKYIAAYQTAPISAITHIAEIASIEPYGDGKKYKLNFAAPAKPVGPLKLGSAHKSSMQGPRYTNHLDLDKAKGMGDLF